MKPINPFSALAGSDVRSTVLVEIDRLLDDGLPVSRLASYPEDAQHEQAFDRGFERRKRVFGATGWKLDEALSLFIGFVEIQALPTNDLHREHLRRFCGVSRERKAMRELFDESASAEADGWIDAVDSSRDHFAINGNRMHPLLWMRWVLTYAPKLVTPVFWTEFGLWRNENYAVDQPLVRGSMDNGSGLVCLDSEQFGHHLMPIDGFIHEPMEGPDFTASIELVGTVNGNLIRKGLADYMTSKRSIATRRARTKTPFDKARARLGVSAMRNVESVLVSLFAQQGRERGWTYRYGIEGKSLIVKESRDELANLVIAHAVQLSIGPLTVPVVRSALRAFVDFPRGRRRRMV